jgi:hypothetical protein
MRIKGIEKLVYKMEVARDRGDVLVLRSKRTRTLEGLFFGALASALLLGIYYLLLRWSEGKVEKGMMVWYWLIVLMAVAALLGLIFLAIIHIFPVTVVVDPMRRRIVVSWSFPGNPTLSIPFEDISEVYYDAKYERTPEDITYMVWCVLISTKDGKKLELFRHKDKGMAEKFGKRISSLLRRDISMREPWTWF